MAKIVSVEVCLARVPLDSPVEFSTRTVTVREYCLVRITSDAGTVGLGYSYAVNGGAALIVDAVSDVLAPRILGDESFRVEGIWQDLYRDALLIGRAGAVMRALSAVDIALWDLNARSVDIPLFKLLGATVIDRVPAYGSGGYYLPGKTNNHLAEEMLAFVRQGYRAVKIKVGRLSPAAEKDRIQIVREAIGPDTRLMLDANNAWRDVPAALEYLHRLLQFNPYWIEEPFSPDDIESHARLAAQISTPIATGEIEAGRWRFKEILDRRAAAFLQVDAIACGGITEWKRIAATASSYGISVAPHAWHDVHAHLVASVPNATYVEFMPDDSIVNFRRLIDTQLVLDHGYLIRTPSPRAALRG